MQNSFVQESILAMGPVSFERLKMAMLGEYISLRVVTPEQVTKEILAEKLLDYFEKFQYKTGKKFEDLLKNYTSELDSLVEPHVAKAPQGKKKEPMPRARKYYEKATEIRKTIKGFSELRDYSRLMLCLYAAIINNDGDKITNLNYSLDCLYPDAIEAALKDEKESALFGKKNPKPRFDTSDPYSMDTSFFVIVLIMLYAMIGDSLEEGIEDE